MKSKSDQRKINPTNIIESWIYAVLICVSMLAGCAQHQQCDQKGQVQVRDISKKETMELAEDILARLHFTIDKFDTPSGLIRTRPLPGAQFFEFWRGDNVGADNHMLANLHTIRRTVELDITEQGEKVQIGCNVKIQRLSLPEREITSSARAYNMFSRSSASLQRLTLYSEQEKATAWIDLGEDIPLATEILRRIENRIRHEMNNKKQTTSDET